MIIMKEIKFRIMEHSSILRNNILFEEQFFLIYLSYTEVFLRKYDLFHCSFVPQFFINFMNYTYMKSYCYSFSIIMYKLLRNNGTVELTPVGRYF